MKVNDGKMEYNIMIIIGMCYMFLVFFLCLKFVLLFVFNLLGNWVYLWMFCLLIVMFNVLLLEDYV